MFKKRGSILLEIMFTLQIYLIVIYLITLYLNVNRIQFKNMNLIIDNILKKEEEIVLSQDYYSTLKEVLQ